MNLRIPCDVNKDDTLRIEFGPNHLVFVIEDTETRNEKGCVLFFLDKSERTGRAVAEFLRSQVKEEAACNGPDCPPKCPGQYGGCVP